VPRVGTLPPLSEEERKNLLLMLKEAEARGITLPAEVQKLVQNKNTMEWPFGRNGYFLKKNGNLYEPSESQAAFIHSGARFALFYGSRASGKSGAGSQKALFKIQQGWSGAVMNPDFENFRYSTWPEFKEWIPWNMVVPTHRHRESDVWQPTQPFTMVFMNGAKVYCKGLKDPNSARGPNLNWLWYDEGGRDDSGLGWKIAVASVRVGDHPQAWTTATPRPKEHWMYRFFIDKEIPQEAIDEFEKASGGDTILVESFHGTIDQNKDHLDPVYFASILAAYPSGFLRSQEVEGLFANEGGKIGNRLWFEGGKELLNNAIIEYPNRIIEVAPEHVLKKVRFWDLAATEKKVVGIGQKKKEMNDPDETVGSLVSKFLGENRKDNFCIEHQVAGWWGWDALLEAIADTARYDGPYVPVVIEEEPGSGGKNQVAAVKTHFKRFPELEHIPVIGQRARDVGDRVMGANHWFAIAAEGRMWIVRGAWNGKFLSQLDGFTQILHDDRVTSITGATAHLSPFKTWARIPFISL
jgi:phage terminase large subunit-like protein